jgi:predicted acyltransferase
MGHLYDGNRDPEGLIHTIPAIGTTLIGVLTGQWLRKQNGTRKLIMGMVLFGILEVIAGGIWNRWFPINKNLWTSSFVLFSGGLALLFLSLLYWMVEVKRWRGAWE